MNSNRLKYINICNFLPVPFDCFVLLPINATWSVMSFLWRLKSKETPQFLMHRYRQRWFPRQHCPTQYYGPKIQRTVASLKYEACTLLIYFWYKIYFIEIISMKIFFFLRYQTIDDVVKKEKKVFFWKCQVATRFLSWLHI